jgi:hypothetical protein
VTRSDLSAQANALAESLQTTINRTVADNAIVNLLDLRGAFALGTHLERDLTMGYVRLNSESRDHQCWLRVEMQVYANDAGHLTTRSSLYGVADRADAADPFFHYDYERNKADYTEAHLQVFGKNTSLEEMMLDLCVKRDKKSMHELHFPVGGRRFRPTLEDVLEFLIDEQLVKAKPASAKILNDARDQFREIQLRASVRKSPEAAADVLRELDYTVTPPAPPKVPKMRGKRRFRPAGKEDDD